MTSELNSGAQYPYFLLEPLASQGDFRGGTKRLVTKLPFSRNFIIIIIIIII